MASLSPLTGTLGKRLAAHLLRRTTFGGTRALINAYATKTVAQAVTELTTITPITSKPIDFKTNQTWVDQFRVNDVNSEDFLLKGFVVGWWMNNALKDNTIQHKLMLFYHQYWMSTHEFVSSELYYDYRVVISYLLK